jgi:hypothetical protein
MAEIAEKNFNIDTLRLMDNDSNKTKKIDRPKIRK